ncbi:MAG: hypothetical protein ACO23R_02685 [bacterium]
MRLIETAVSHFNSKAVRKIEVPEWGVKLYARNLTLEDKTKWLRRAENDTTMYLIYSLIFGLVDEKGEPVFTIEDIASLRKSADPDIVQRLGNFVLLPQSQSEDEREKN